MLKRSWKSEVGSSKYLSIILTLLVTNLFSQNKEAAQIHYANTITKDNLKKHLSVLASDEYEGRETGEKGQKMAANYIAAQFKEEGLRPGVHDTSYFQRFPLDVQYKKEVFLKYIESMNPELLVKKKMGSEQNLFNFLTEGNYNFRQVEHWGVFRYDYYQYQMQVI